MILSPLFLSKVCNSYWNLEDVMKLVKQVQSSLANHGIGEATDGGIITSGQDSEEDSRGLIVPRRKEFKEENILIPQVLYVKNNKKRKLDYERDILAKIKWDELKYEQQILSLENKQVITEGWISSDTDDLNTNRIAVDGQAKDVFFARNLSDIVPNPWQAMRVVKDARISINKQGTTKDIYNARMNIVRQMRIDIENQKEQQAESIFQQKLNSKEILFALDTRNSAWEIPSSFNLERSNSMKIQTKKTGESFNRSLFEKYSAAGFNDFEEKVACYLDEGSAIKWWHRVAARQEYGLQGWRKHLVYPDFIALISNDKEKILILETKGSHLAKNLDTTYKEKLFAILEEKYEVVLNLNLSNVGDEIMLRVVYDTSWNQELGKLINIK